MKTLAILGMNLLLLTGFLSPVMAGAEPSPLTSTANQPDTVAVDHVVYPTGIYPTDVDSVQAAVSQGGTVLLKAKNTDGQPTAFEFGFYGGILVTDDVRIFGEGSGSVMTTIRGGFIPVRGLAPVYLAVRGIRFEGPLYCAILSTASTGADLSNNFITGVIGVQIDPEMTKGNGIWFLGRDIFGDNELNPYAISGSIIIADNTIEDVDASLGHGIVMVSFGADTTIAGNRISGVNTAGIATVLNTEVVRVEDNIILPGPERYSQYFSAGNGIWSDWSLGGDFYFAQNTIVCENPMADGIVVSSTYLQSEPLPDPEIAIERNHVTMLGAWGGGISLYQGFSSAYVGKNRIDGDGSWAIGVLSGDFPEVPMTANTFQGNNVSGFTSNIADYLLDVSTQNTVVLGKCGTVVDLGLANRVTGVTRMRGDVPVGQVIREAQAKRRALAEATKVDRFTHP